MNNELDEDEGIDFSDIPEMTEEFWKNAVHSDKFFRQYHSDTIAIVQQALEGEVDQPTEYALYNMARLFVGIRRLNQTLSKELTFTADSNGGMHCRWRNNFGVVELVTFSTKQDTGYGYIYLKNNDGPSEIKPFAKLQTVAEKFIQHIKDYQNKDD